MDQLWWCMLLLFSRSETAPRLALLCWGNFVVLRCLPGSSPLRSRCTSSSSQTPLSATMDLKLPMTLPCKVRVVPIFTKDLRQKKHFKWATSCTTPNNNNNQYNNKYKFFSLIVSRYLIFINTMQVQISAVSRHPFKSVVPFSLYQAVVTPLPLLQAPLQAPATPPATPMVPTVPGTSVLPQATWFGCRLTPST